MVIFQVRDPSTTPYSEPSPYPLARGLVSTSGHVLELCLPYEDHYDEELAPGERRDLRCSGVGFWNHQPPARFLGDRPELRVLLHDLALPLYRQPKLV